MGLIKRINQTTTSTIEEIELLPHPGTTLYHGNTINVTAGLLPGLVPISYNQENLLGDIVDKICQYYAPIIIVVGLVGNFLSCIVFLKTHLRMRSSSYYLAALASADFSNLVAVVFVWLDMYGIQVYHEEGWCQVITYVSHVCGFLSPWLIVAFTVERFIAVQYPLHRPHMCTVSRAKGVVVCMSAFSLLAYTYTLLTSGIITAQNGSPSCELLEDYSNIMKVINVVDTIATLVLPTILIIVMNGMITRNLVLFGRRFRQAGVPKGTTMSWADGQAMPGPETASNSSSNSGSSNNNNKNRFLASQSSFGSKGGLTMAANGRGQSSSVSRISLPNQMGSSGRTLVSTRTQQSITKMLLLISSVFILLNLPSHMMRVLGSDDIPRDEIPPALWFAQQISMLLYYTHFSINFLLYSMCGMTFRRCLWQLVRNSARHVCCSCRGRWLRFR